MGLDVVADIYDPSTGTFTTTGPLLHDWGWLPSLVTLEDGRVLVVGAASIDEIAGDTGAEIYDPAAGRFAAIKPLIDRSAAAAALLQDGRVLIAGGADVRKGRCLTASAELFDPKSNKFTFTGSMKDPRAGATTMVLKDGRVLIAGGGQCSDAEPKPSAFATAEIFDPQTGRFSLVGSMTADREDDTATLLQDGRVLFTGGTSASSELT